MLLLAMPALAHWIPISLLHTHVIHVSSFIIYCPFEVFLSSLSKICLILHPVDVRRSMISEYQLRIALLGTGTP